VGGAKGSLVEDIALATRLRAGVKSMEMSGISGEDLTIVFENKREWRIRSAAMDPESQEGQMPKLRRLEACEVQPEHEATIMQPIPRLTFGQGRQKGGGYQRGSAQEEARNRGTPKEGGHEGGNFQHGRGGDGGEIPDRKKTEPKKDTRDQQSQRR